MKPSVARRYQHDLEVLCADVLVFLHQLDALMQQPSTVERGKKIARLCNALEMTNDRIRYGTLGINFRTDKKSHSVPVSSTHAK